MRRLSLGWVAVTVAATLVATGAGAQLPPEQAIFPEKEYRQADSRVLGQAYAAELRALYADVRRCAPELEFQQRGIGFWKPRDVATALPHLALWVWVDPGLISWGQDIQARAAHAFHRFARRLVPTMLARAPVRDDQRVEGYGLVMSWLGPAKSADDRPVGETLATFFDKESAAAFTDGTLNGTDFLARARVKLFGGEVEVQPPGLTVEDWRVAAVKPTC